MEFISTFNPLFYLFLSYAFGAWGTTLINKLGIFSHFENHNYLNDRFTKLSGALLLKPLVVKSPLKSFNRKISYTGRPNIEKLQQLRLEMSHAENGHLIAFIIFQLAIIVFGVLGIALWKLVGYTITNIIFNFYLVLLQQYNKRRVDGVLCRLIRA